MGYLLLAQSGFLDARGLPDMEKANPMVFDPAAWLITLLGRCWRRLFLSGGKGRIMPNAGEDKIIPNADED
ncbi:MAG TPA: hypothetical protein DCK81_01700 [Clostridiales bacterium UBA9856]|nr:hypothetical protein [Clostridiales bacterium UBA9856]HOA42510.1 hypothetical protein [Bacillota bacterium]